MAKSKNTPSYQEAMQEIQSILDTLKTAEIDIDTLAEKVERAQWLIDYCKTKLRNTEQALSVPTTEKIK